MNRKNKTGVLFILICLLGGFGCPPRSPRPGAEVEQKSYPIRFLGYKGEYKVNARVEQMEQLLLDPHNIIISSGPLRIEFATPAKCQKPGDQIPYNVSLLGIPFPGRMTLVSHREREEIIYISQAEKYGAIMVFRFRFRPIGEATAVSIRFELEESRGLVETVGQTINFAEVMGRAIDAGWAQIQSSFDPNLKPEELLKGGARGQSYDRFYQANEGSVWINAGARKVEEVMNDPKVWEALAREYGAEATRCLLPRTPGLCSFHLKILGIEAEINSFPGVIKPGSYAATFMISPQIISRLETSLETGQGGVRVRMRLTYAPEFPGAFSKEAADIAVSVLQFPEMIEQVLLNAKQAIEGVG